MARVPRKFKAQLLTADADGNQVKRNFNNVRMDISDDELLQLSKGIQGVLNGESLRSMILTANSALDIG